MQSKCINDLATATHDQLQAQCWQHAWNTYPQHRYRFFSVANSAAGFLGRNKTMQLKACGLLKGVWDMPVFDRAGACHWLEFKVGADKLSPDQIKFMQAMLPLGNQFFYEIRSFAEFCSIFNCIIEQNSEKLKELQVNDPKTGKIYR